MSTNSRASVQGENLVTDTPQNHSVESTNTADEVLAWDLGGAPERGPTYQPWRDYWPPKASETLSEEELKAKPWLTWKRDQAQPNEKPWYGWVNVFSGEVDLPCQLRRPEGPGGPEGPQTPIPENPEGECPYCEGSGCVCLSTCTMSLYG